MPIDDGRQKLKWKSWQIDLANGCIKEEWGTMHKGAFWKNCVWWQLNDHQFDYSRIQNKRTPKVINFLNFFQGPQSYYGLKDLNFTT